MRSFFAALVLLVVTISTCSAETYEQRLHRFDYDPKTPLDIQDAGTQNRDGVQVQTLSYASLKGGRVPAYLVVPSGKGPFAAIIYAHWAMNGSSMRNRTEFLDEAVVMARAGVVSLLIDAPFARPGFVQSPDPLGPQETDVMFQQIMDVRRGVDLLISRSDVDPNRIAFVGHSFDAQVGGVLSGVEKRIKDYVLMCGVLAVSDEVMSNDEGMVAIRAKLGDENVRNYLATYDWLDPVHYISHAAPSALFLQYAKVDGISGAGPAQHFYSIASEPKMLKVYDAPHALNAEARHDRVEWLQKELHLRSVDYKALDKLPELPQPVLPGPVVVPTS
jgi:dienelactone hydrolase